MCYNIFGKRQEDLLCYTKAAVFLGAFSSFCPNRMGQNRFHKKTAFSSIQHQLFVMLRPIRNCYLSVTIELYFSHSSPSLKEKHLPFNRCLMVSVKLMLVSKSWFRLKIPFSFWTVRRCQIRVFPSAPHRRLQK